MKLFLIIITIFLTFQYFPASSQDIAPCDDALCPDSSWAIGGIGQVEIECNFETTCIINYSYEVRHYICETDTIREYKIVDVYFDNTGENGINCSSCGL